MVVGFAKGPPIAVILSPSPTVILSEAKDLAFRLRVNSAQDPATS
jgi:hypothetical protein